MQLPGMYSLGIGIWPTYISNAAAKKAWPWTKRLQGVPSPAPIAVLPTLCRPRKYDGSALTAEWPWRHPARCVTTAFNALNAGK